MELNKNILGNAVNILKDFENECIDLVVTSPPYDAQREYNKLINNKTVFRGGYSFPFEEMADELYRVLKIGGVIVWVVNDQVKNGGETGTSFKMALYFKSIGFTLYDTMIYHKSGAPFPETGRYSQVFEYMFILSKGKPKTVNILKDRKSRWAGSKTFSNPTMRNKDGSLKIGKQFSVAEYGSRYNVWYILNGKGFTTKDEYAYETPAMFPESLAEDHILSWSNEGDIVLDPMCGAATTGKMALLNNRKYIGIEINEKYLEIANRRISNIVPYTIENPNPKVKFILSREDSLKKRRKKKLNFEN